MEWDSWPESICPKCKKWKSDHFSHDCIGENHETSFIASIIYIFNRMY